MRKIRVERQNNTTMNFNEIDSVVTEDKRS
jgi:hypothetical protein